MSKSIPYSNILLKKIIFPLIIVVFLAILGYFLLVVNYVYSSDRINENLSASEKIFEKEGYYPKLFLREYSTLDNFTDAIMLSEIYSSIKDAENNCNPFLSSLNASYIVDTNDKFVFCDHQTSLDQKDVSYPRYWHGNIVLLKPLLLLFNYASIRLINVSLITLLFSCLLILFFKFKLRGYVIPLILFAICIGVPYCGFSLQFCSCTYISLISSIVVILLSKKFDLKKILPYIFTFIGAITAYFDFLTYPIITLGLPLLCCLLVNKNNSKSSLLLCLISIVYWFFGYSFMWMLKWLICLIINLDGFLSETSNALLYRTSFVGGSIFESFYALLYRNCAVVSYNPLLMLILICFILFYFIVIVACIIYCIFSHKKYKINFHTIASFVIIMSLPFFWYLLVQQHSYVHWFMTFKGLSIFICGFSCMTAYLGNCSFAHLNIKLKPFNKNR